MKEVSQLPATDSRTAPCDLCVENELMWTIIWQDDDAYLCRCLDKETGMVVDGQYMFVPKHHGDQLPGWALVRLGAALKKVNVEPDNISIDLTEQGGREHEHAHIDIIMRADTSRLSLSTLAGSLKSEIQETENEHARLLGELNSLRQQCQVHH